METITLSKAINILREKRVSLFDINDAKKIWRNLKQDTLYKLIQRLENKGIIERLIKGKYNFTFSVVSDFEIANFLIVPSYISLESALSFYGIVPQFPYTITSVTPLKPRKITIKNKEYEFTHIKRKYFWGYIKKESFLIALPEKALLDEIYLVSKKLRKINLNEIDISKINKKRFKEFFEKYDFLPLRNIVKKIC